MHRRERSIYTPYICGLAALRLVTPGPQPTVVRARAWVDSALPTLDFAASFRSKLAVYPEGRKEGILAEPNLADWHGKDLIDRFSGRRSANSRMSTSMSRRTSRCSARSRRV